MRIKTILALTDCDEGSLAGLHYAATLARRKDAKMVVGHVLVPRTLDPANVRAFLEAHGLGDAATVDIEIDADVFGGIDLLVDENRPELLVLSSARKTGFKRVLSASIPVGLVGDVTVPVLALHAGQEVDSFRKVLVCVDGSPLGRDLLAFAARLVEDGGEMCAFMAIEDSPLVIGGLSVGKWSEEMLAKAADAARAYLGSLPCPREGIRFSTQHEVGDAVALILGKQQQLGSDLVAIGAGGVGGRSGFFLGKVADAIIRDCPAPTLIMPSDGVMK